MDKRVLRVAANEAVFRELNAQLEGLAAKEDALTCVCECGELSCVEPIALTRTEYEHVRADKTTFVVKPGHVKPGVEDVVETTREYEIVRKKEGVPAQLARDTA